MTDAPSPFLNLQTCVYRVDDPWIEPEDGDTDTDTFELPVPSADLDRMAWYGATPYRAVVLLEPPR